MVPLLVVGPLYYPHPTRSDGVEVSIAKFTGQWSVSINYADQWIRVVFESSTGRVLGVTFLPYTIP